MPVVVSTTIAVVVPEAGLEDVAADPEPQPAPGKIDISKTASAAFKVFIISTLLV
jgi:hypothetical protein